MPDFECSPNVDTKSGLFSEAMQTESRQVSSQEKEVFSDIDWLHLSPDLSNLFQKQRLSEIGTMTSSIAHEINNPVTGIINYAQLIYGRTQDAELRELAEEIKKEGERIANLVRNLLNFARCDSNKFQLVALEGVVEDAINLMKVILCKDDIMVAVKFEANLPHLWCIPQKITQVVVNLLSNARQALNTRYPHYHPNKRILIEGGVQQDSEGNWLRLSVTDWGLGIREEIREKIFKPFFTTYANNGTGLGLALCQQIVKEHRGRLNFQSKVGAYTRFDVDLPFSSTTGE
jgi:signal transduction histidine kinase